MKKPVVLSSKKKLNENEEFCLYCDVHNLYAELRAYFKSEEYPIEEYKEEFDGYDFRPKTGLDYLKECLINFCPSLQFGWLVPEYELIRLKTIYIYKDVYRITPLSSEEMDCLDTDEEGCICEH